MYPNQHSRGHVFSCIRPYSAVFTVFFSVVFTRCSEYAAQHRIPALKMAYSTRRQETWARVCAELKSCFDASAGEAYDGAPPPPADGVAASPLLREVSAKVEAEAPEGSGPHELQVLLLSTVYQLLQSMCAAPGGARGEAGRAWGEAGRGDGAGRHRPHAGIPPHLDSCAGWPAPSTQADGTPRPRPLGRALPASQPPNGAPAGTRR